MKTENINAAVTAINESLRRGNLETPPLQGLYEKAVAEECKSLDPMFEPNQDFDVDKSDFGTDARKIKLFQRINGVFT